MDSFNNYIKISTPEDINKAKKEIHLNPIELQDKVLKSLLNKARNTRFGLDHGFSGINSHSDYRNNVPIRDYYDYNKYWDLIFTGNDNILWPGKPIYFATTSASTGSPKHIPITNESMATFIHLTLKVIMQYMYDKKDPSLFNYHFMNLTSAYTTTEYKGYNVGPISGIGRKMVPSDLAINSLPSDNALDLIPSKGWQAMFEQAAKDALANPISVCTGLPSWLAHFFRVCSEVGNTENLSELFPDLKLLCTSGVNYRPYLPQFNKLFNKGISVREFYAASEGAFAYQDTDFDNGMLLNINDGIFFEFIPLEYAQADNPPRIGLADTRPNTSYVPVITTNAGLWCYRMGDIIQFSSVSPYRLEVIGRTTHFISVVAEHVYSQNVEEAIQKVSEEMNLSINNFTVAPNLTSSNRTPFYDWYLEIPDYNNSIDKSELAFRLDFNLKQHAISYANRRRDGALDSPKVHFLKNNAFIDYLKLKNNDSLQLKVPKLSNDRDIAIFLVEANLVIDQEPELTV